MCVCNCAHRCFSGGLSYLCPRRCLVDVSSTLSLPSCFDSQDNNCKSMPPDAFIQTSYSRFNALSKHQRVCSTASTRQPHDFSGVSVQLFICRSEALSKHQRVCTAAKPMKTITRQPQPPLEPRPPSQGLSCNVRQTCVDIHPCLLKS
jgi:hypothetical protein